MHVNSLRKHEILRKKQQISELFRSRKKLKGEYVRVVYSFAESGRSSGEAQLAALFAVSRKTVHDAVRRNRIKRLMREAYRQEKGVLSENIESDGKECPGGQLCLAFIYTGAGERFPDFAVLRREIRRLLRTIKSC
ncbi:ribonuclease P protein component [Chlorobium sp.]|uniref:ribonuclease P protein component n=1 Tax=Chlorobium sp. TaxID=1095 RepID=UPI0025BD72E5|nr:ribonuclease P protein component [Chlorobium sp.]